MSQISVAKNVQKPKVLTSRYYRGRYLSKIALLTIFLFLPLTLGFGLFFSLFAPLAFLVLGVIIVLSLIAYRPIVGFFLITLIAVSLELFGVLDPISLVTAQIYRSLSAFTPIPIPFSGFEFLTFYTFLLTFLHAFSRKESLFPRGTFGYAYLGFMFFLLIGFLYGVGRGGVLNIAVYETRGFIGAFLMYILASYHLRDFRNWQALTWLFPLGAVLLSVFTFTRYVMIGFDLNKTPESNSLNGANHSTVMFYLVLFFWFICIIFYKGWKGQFWVCFLTVPPTFFAMLISGRRVAFAAMIFCFGVFGAVLAMRKRRTALITSVIAIIILAPYTAAFWNSESIIAEPAQAIRSQISPSERDASSDLYRIIERHNVHQTIRSAPLMGIGFGQQFYEFIPMISLGHFDMLQKYTPHANFLWIWLKVGAGGFAAWCLLIILAIFQLGQIARYGKEGPEFSLVVLAGIFIASWLVYVYYDIGAVDARLMYFLGVCFALIDIAYRRLENQAKAKKNPFSLNQSKKLFQVELTKN